MLLRNILFSTALVASALFASSSSLAAVTIDATSTAVGQAGGVTSVALASGALQPTASATAVALTLSMSDTGISALACNWDGQALTKVVSVAHTTAPFVTAYIFGFAGSMSGHTGAGKLGGCSWSGPAASAAINGVSFAGTAGSTGAAFINPASSSPTANSASPSLAMTNASGAIALSGYIDFSSNVTGLTQTFLPPSPGWSNSIIGFAAQTSTAVNPTFGLILSAADNYALVAISVAPASGGASCQSLALLGTGC